MREEIRLSLENSAKKIAIEIASLMKEKISLSKKVDESERKNLILRAKVDVHKEKRDQLQQERRELQNKKGVIYDEKNKISDQRKILKTNMYAQSVDWDSSQPKLKEFEKQISILMDEINVIKKEVDLISQEADKEHQLFVMYTDELYKNKKLIENEKNLIEKRSLQLDKDLNKLRLKMKNIQSKLE